MDEYHADFGPVVRIVTVTSHVTGYYDSVHPESGESWLAQFDNDLARGLYGQPARFGLA